ncbi:hypothetical protein RB653_002223 [Dictyostelium firmibasis]|uniref:MJ1316 RNA cyclic group end recognition domain-containing protein n=1 Tax=Dictyostelium firmibasis TaxID=79012 RepID=A0AAN7YVG6_9MYCE
MSTTIYFSYPTYSNQREFTTYDDSEDEDYDYDYDQSHINGKDYSLKTNQLNNELNKTNSGHVGCKTGQVIPRTDKNYKAAIEYKKAKKLAIKQLKENKLSTSPTNQQQQQQLSESIEELSESNEESSSSSSDENSNKTKKLTKSEVKSIIEKETDLKKKERLPSSIEVYNRILHDEQLFDKIQDFIIAYEDRFDGLREVEFLKLDKEIPFHRIRQFRHLNQIVWSRSERIYDFSSLLS